MRQQWHLAGHVSTNKCAGIVGCRFFSSIVVLTPNGNFWIAPLLHSVSDYVYMCTHTHTHTYTYIRTYTRARAQSGAKLTRR